VGYLRFIFTRILLLTSENELCDDDDISDYSVKTFFLHFIADATNAWRQ
jgi:hypothetical protein